jgi:hypothetical protein
MTGSMMTNSTKWTMVLRHPQNLQERSYTITGNRKYSKLEIVPRTKGTGDTEVTELTKDNATEATESAPLRRSERNTNRPSKYVAAQLKECDKPKECGKLKECTTGIKECKQGVSLAQLEHCHNIMVEDDSTVKEVFYSQGTRNAKVMARFIVEIHQGASNHGASFAQNYILQKGLKLFGEAGSKAAGKELDQLHSRNCFSPRDISTMTDEEKRKALEALMFLTEKRDGTINGSTGKTAPAPQLRWKACC